MTFDGFDAETLATRLGVPMCQVHDRVTSTLDVVHRLAGEGAPAGAVVLAEEQTAGRGRHGDPWYSPPGAGIWLGYLARPEGEGESGVRALRVGLAAVAALRSVGVDVALKWPNDLVARDRKLGGILCEARSTGGRLHWLAIGIGINMRGPLPEGLAARAISVAEVASDVTRIAVLEALVPRLVGVPDTPQLTAQELATYERHDWLRGKTLRRPREGRAGGVAADGALLVETGSGVQRAYGGSVVTA
jgi:BirA family biotin operon repressor/biotin-[acetyl-CoA-carboxylase] ligase